MIPPPPRSTLFPYTTLFRSKTQADLVAIIDEIKGNGTIRLHVNKYIAHLDFELLARSEEHTSELQSRLHLVCRLLLEKKKINRPHNITQDATDVYKETDLVT